MDNNKTERGVLAVVSGFSGAGKGTAMKRLMEREEGYALSVSATTRNPRPGEVDGREYFFKTREQFEEMIAKDELIEYAEYVGNYYGTPKAYVEKMLSEGKNVILEIETQGAAKVKKKFPDAALLFITAPSMDALAERLRGRKTEKEDAIGGRLRQAAREALLINDYDYVIVNQEGGIEKCVDDIHGIIQAERKKTSNCRELVEQLISQAVKYK